MITIDIRKADRVSGKYGLFISSPYDETVISVVHMMSSAMWHKPEREWEIPFSDLTKFVDSLSNYEIELKGELGALVEKKAPNVNFDFKTKPFDHQIDGFNYGLTHDAWLLGDEQGLGKTWQVINIALAKKQMYGYKHCLIVCGVNGLKYNWFNEIAKHSDETGHILGWRDKKNGKGKVKTITNADKLFDIERIDELPYFIITNVESLRDEKIADALKMLCKNKVIDMIAIDEIHRCKDATSQQGKGILKLDAEDKIAMTGTPVLNTPLDLYIILKWLGYENHSFYAFKNHYAVMGGFGNYQVIGYKNKEELQAHLDNMMLRRLKEDVFDLPDKIFVDEYVEMSRPQAKIYQEILDDIRLNVDKIAETPNPLSQLIRLRQATGYTGILSTEIEVSAKLDRMEELVDDAVANGRKVVVFSNWTQITDEAEKRLKTKYRGVVITGETSDADRQMNVDAFQNDPDIKYIIGTVGAMGTGLTLTAGTVEIFLDEPWTAAMKNQAIDRCHRIGTSENVTIYTLLTKDTIDERIHEIVYSKGKMSDELIDGKVVGDKRQLIDYLIG